MSATLASISTLADRVMLQLPGCPYPLAMEALRQVTRDLCRRTGIWTEDVEVEGEADTLEYELDVPTGAVLVAIGVLKNDDGDAIDKSGVSVRPPTTLVFANDPGANDYTVAMICQPSGDTVPDWLLTAEQDTLIAGAVAVRKRDGAKPWSAQDWPVWQAAWDDRLYQLRVRSQGNFAGLYDTALQGVRVL